MSAPPLIVTTSWDDGAPTDMKLAEVLAEYGIPGTFYVPRRNIEGRKVMSTADLLGLSRTFEIGGHTVDHVKLTTLDRHAASKQIQDCKAWLEDITGRPINGFCYPRGGYNRIIKDLTKDAGFIYSRTAMNFCSSLGQDRFEMPTTVQLFPHSKLVYLRNFVKYGSFRARKRLFLSACGHDQLVDRIKRLATLCAQSGGFFHLWGHSWEIEELQLWDDLRSILKHLSQELGNAKFTTNHQLYCTG